MPKGQHAAATLPKDAEKNLQGTSANTKKCYKLREPLTKLHVSSNTNVCEHTGQGTKDNRHRKSGEHGGVCCTRQQENDTSDAENAEELTQKYHKTTSHTNEDLPTTTSDCGNNVPSLGSPSLLCHVGEQKDKESGLDCHVSEQKDKHSGLDCHVSEQKDKESGLDCHVSEQKHKESGLDCHVGEQKDKHSGLDCHVSEQKDKESGLDCHVSEQKHKESGLDCHVGEQKDKHSGLDCHVSEQKDKETQVDDCLCGPSNEKSQASFVVRVNDHTKSGSDDECASLHLESNSTNESVSNHDEATNGELSSRAWSSSNSSCERKTRHDTAVKECNKCDTICQGIASRENITELPLHSNPNSVQQDRSVRADNHQSTRTTIELNAHSVNSGRKYSDFSISFLLSQGSPSMRGTIRCHQTNSRRRCDNTRHNCFFETFCGNNPTSCSCATTQPACSSANKSTHCSCGNNTQSICSSANTPTTCSCDVSSCNPETTNYRHDDNCQSRQTLASAARCCDKHQSGSSSVGPFRSRESPHRSHSQTFNLPPTSSDMFPTDHKLDSSWTQSTGNDVGSMVKGEASGDEMFADCGTRCSTPVRRQVKRTWTADDSNNSQIQTDPDSSMDNSMLTGTSKMARFKYTEEQILYLKDEFIKNRYPSYDDLAKMSEDTTVPVRQLQVWFQNKRASTTGTRRPKMRRIDDYLEFDSLNKPPTDGEEVAHPTQPCLVLPPSCTDTKVQSLQTGPVIRDYGHQPYLPRMFADFLGRHQDLPANTFTNGPSGIAQTQQRHLHPVQYPAHLYPRTALDAGSLQAYLTPLYGHSPGVGLRYPDINSLQMFNSYLAHAGAPPAGNSQLFAFLGHPAVQPTPSVSNPRDLNPADIFMTSLLPQTSNSRDKGKLP